MRRLHRSTPTIYRIGRAVLRAVRFQTLRIKTLRLEITDRPGGYVLAPTHISHLEPFILTMAMNRHVDWMARIEFYGRWWTTVFLNRAGAFPVRRQGVPVSTIRTAIHRLQSGRVVGIFPEGGVAVGIDSLCRGAPMKRGACLVAYRSNVPVVPCVVIGTHRLNEVGPWIPFRRARLWIAFGEPVWPDRTLKPRAARASMASILELTYQSLYREMGVTFGLDERSIP